MTHQVSVDETVCLQVLHPLTDVLTHGQKPRLLQSPAPLPQEVQQAAVLHELGHNQQGALLQANTIQLHQFGVAQSPGRDNKHTVSFPCIDNKEVAKTPSLLPLFSSSSPPLLTS